MSELYQNIVRSRTGLGYPQTARYVKKAVAATLAAEGVDEACAVEILLTDDAEISMERCAAQAEEFGHSFAHEVTYLAIHSTLHLLGYDHEDEGAQKKQMRTREKEILHILGENE